MELNENKNFNLSEDELQFMMNQEFLDEFPNLIETLHKPQFTIGHLNLTPRDANYWDKQGILPEVKGEGHRRKYDLVQSMWIKFIQQMRSLGINLETIKKLKDDLLKSEVEIDEWKKEDVIRVIEEMNQRLGSNFEVEDILKKIGEQKPLFFETVILVAIIYRKPLYCLVNKDGRYFVYSPRGHHALAETHAVFHEFMSLPYFSLSLTEAYKELVCDWAPKKFMANISILSNTEQEILDYLRKKDINSITIRYKEGEIDLLEIDEKNEISIEQRFLDVIAKNGFQKISVTTRNGKIVHFENKILKKLNKRTK
jgi:DNA-binding transcriptional MerR regulator